MKQASASYAFNSMQDIKSHSAALYNERMAILFFVLDTSSIDMNMHHRPEDVTKVRAILKQLYKNVRMLIRNNPMIRSVLNLETADPGIYVTDVALGMIDKMIEFCEINGYTKRKLFVIAEELNRFEMLMKDTLQYYSYFIRPEFKQKPDVDTATEKYRTMIDQATVDQLKTIVGKNSKINLESLGIVQVDKDKPVNYDKVVDGSINVTEESLVNSDDIDNDDYDEDTDGYDLNLDGDLSEFAKSDT